MPIITALLLASLSPSAKEAAVRAEKDVFDSEANAHLLMTSTQAALKRMQWSFNRWGRPEGRALAGELFDKTTDLISRFRTLSESVMIVSDPTAPMRIKTAKSERVKQAARDVPEKAAKQIEEIFRMRAAYDADASRSALTRARSAMETLEGELGKTELKPSQRRVLALTEAFRSHLAGARARVRAAMPAATARDSGAERKGRELVVEELGILAGDAEALAVEAEKLSILYRLNSYLKASEESR